MTRETLIRKLVDFVLLNAYSLSSTGLYNGKAGFSLTLFEVARFLNDDYIENQACELLQEALLSTTEDMSFENGLAGIGYVLLYLSNNGFIDADFDELFEKQNEKIMKGIDDIKQQPNLLLASVQMAYFFRLVKKKHIDDERIDVLNETLFDAMELYLAMQFINLANQHYVNCEMKVLKMFGTYLELVYKCKYDNYSYVIINEYAKLYRNERMIGSFKVRYYLEKLDTGYDYKDIVDNNMNAFLKHVNLSSLALNERIWLADITNADLIEVLFKEENLNLLENRLLRMIPDNASVAGLEQGISRLLLHMIRVDYL